MFGPDVSHVGYDSNYGQWMGRYPDSWRTELENGSRNKILECRQKDFLKSEYWSRVWILQEVVLPERSLMLSGYTVIPFCYTLTTCWWIFESP